MVQPRRARIREALRYAGKIMTKKLLIPLLLLVLAGALAAQAKFEYWPGAVYDPRIPTFRQVLGYDAGERLTWHAGLMKYMEALAAATKQVKIFEYAKSWEGRKLIYAAVGSETNLRRLEEIRAGMQKLADVRRTSEAEARKLIGSLPAVVWLGYGVHGNEMSSPEAALLTAYHLLAARKDKMVDDILANVLVMIVPTQNPDGRDRFVHHFEQAEGLEPDANPPAAEHVENWPGGRSNHYLFDMNRDWIALTQPEIRGQVKALLEWYPLVYVDLHEMGADSTYYFAPEAHPYNPHLTREQKESLEWFGKNNARWFDRYGFDYFTREVFDAFYPGYGASWPCFYGAVAMTYEQASTRGLVVRRSDESMLHFRDTVRHHFVASVSTLETAAQHRQRLLEQFYRYRKTAIEEGERESIREYILPRRGDTAAVDKLAAVLAEQGVELKRATAAFRNAGKEYPAGTYVISLAQPAKRLIRTLLDPNVPMDEKFLKEQERLRRKKLPDEIYDVTAWSLPTAFNVEAVAAGEVSQGSFEPAKPQRIPPGTMTGKASVAYLAPGGNRATGRLMTAALRQELHVLAADKAFTQNGRRYPAGTLIFKVQDNPADLAARLAKLAASTGAELVGADSSWVEEGVNFGSRHVFRLRKPNVALAWDRPTSSTSAGWTRFVLEREFEYPVSAVRTASLSSADLRRFETIILPDSTGEGYAQVLGTRGVQRLKDWVSAGGTLVGLAGAVSFLADPRVALLAVQQEELPREAKPAERPKPEAAKEARTPGKLLASEEDFRKAIQAETELPDRVLGVMVRARFDPDHWLTAGLGDTVHALFSGRAIFTPIKLDKGVNAAVFLGPDQLVAGGYLWEENRKQLAYKPLILVQREGRGLVVGFTADPNFRAYLDGMSLAFLNAVFRGPAHTRGGGPPGD
jgi:hypothetical protein